MQVEDKAKDSPAEEKQQESTVQVSSGKATQVLVKEDPVQLDEFHNNDTKVLELLNEAGSSYTFKGLMRKLNLHQQSLARALRRLEELGLVRRTEFGYSLRPAINRAEHGTPKGAEYAQLLQTYIPGNVRAGEVLRQLAGRWFKNLRWLGMIDSGTGYTLQWASEDGSFQVNLKLIQDYVIIETNAASEREKVQAMAGSFAIFEQITKAVQSRLPNSYRLDYHPGANN